MCFYSVSEACPVTLASLDFSVCLLALAHDVVWELVSRLSFAYELDNQLSLPLNDDKFSG